MCYFDTVDLEANSRMGCRFCSLLLQVLRDGNNLDTIRGIEARFKTLNENAQASLWLDGVYGGLTIRLPGWNSARDLRWIHVMSQ